MTAATETTELIHLRKVYASWIVCGGAEAPRVTEVFNDTTCPRCRYDGTPEALTERRAREIEATHAEALEINAQYGPAQEAEMASTGTPEPASPNDCTCWATSRQGCPVHAVDENKLNRRNGSAGGDQ